MFDKAKPDLLMVTTVDGFHHEYIIEGLDRGLDVMTEKPLTTDETKCQAILDAEKRNNRKIVVTFNYRYAPAHQQMKEILLSSEIGKVVVGRLQLSTSTSSTARTTSAAGTGCARTAARCSSTRRAITST